MVLLVDDHPLFRLGLAAVLAQEGGRVAVHEAGSMLAALDSLALHPAYDLILYGWHLPDGGGLRGLMALCKRAPGVPVVVISGDGDEAIGVAARTVGASGYLSKAAEPMAIRRVLASLLGLVPADGAVATPDTTLGAASPVILTRRQREVLHLMAQGHANKRIASRLGIAEATVQLGLARVGTCRTRRCGRRAAGRGGGEAGG